MYDYLLVGAGLFNAVIAFEANKHGKSCLVIEKRKHIGGNCYTEVINDIVVHKYGAHIFRTSDKNIWDYMQQFAEWNNFINSPIAKFHNEIYNLPFNMNTFSKMWGISTPDEAKKIIQEQCKDIKDPNLNLENRMISLVGRDIYEKLIKGYTEKQWGRGCTELPADIVRRLPVRFIYDNNYYNDSYQGIPIGGYTPIFEKMFSNCEIILGEDYNLNKSKYDSLAKQIIYTGAIDEYFDYIYNPLEYRSVSFEHEHLNLDNYQGVAVVNYTDKETPYTRIIEHKHFEFGNQKTTVISKEYPSEWKPGIEPYYPINDAKNQIIYSKYQSLAENKENVLFGGRLGSYQYYDMQDTIKEALKLSKKLLF